MGLRCESVKKLCSEQQRQARVRRVLSRWRLLKRPKSGAVLCKRPGESRTLKVCGAVRPERCLVHSANQGADFSGRQDSTRSCCYVDHKCAVMRWCNDRGSWRAKASCEGARALWFPWTRQDCLKETVEGVR